MFDSSIGGLDALITAQKQQLFLKEFFLTKSDLTAQEGQYKF